MAFTMQLFNHGIPITIKEAPSLEPWKKAMKKEMRTLEKTRLGRRWIFLKDVRPWGANRFITLSIKLMDQWKDTRQDS